MAAKRRYNSHARRTKPRTQGGMAAIWLRIPIEVPKGRPLRVLIYARYSTDEQNPRSIDDQVDYCRRFLEALGLHDVEITVLYDKGMSGELVSRPGIDEVLAGARWDLILCEDASRLYRHETACGELIETAVDEGIRVIFINDFVDTAEPDWDDRLHEASRHRKRAAKRRTLAKSFMTR
jgi:DNA invertase Pin-like site-specific DNA recombinase